MRAGGVPTSLLITAITAIAAASRVEKSHVMQVRRSRRPLQTATSQKVEAILASPLSEGMLGRRHGLTSTSSCSAVCSAATLALGEGPSPATCDARRDLGREVRHVSGLAVRTVFCKTARVARPCRPKSAGESGKRPSQMGRILATFMPPLVPKGEVVRAAGRGMPV